MKAPEHYIGQSTLEVLIKHYERRSPCSARSWRNAKLTDIVDDTLQALRELYETNYPPGGEDTCL